MYLVSATPTKLLIEFLWNFTQPADVCCCLKFRRGDNSTCTFTKRGIVYLVSATPPKRLIGVLWNFTQLQYTPCRCAWRTMVAVQNLKGETIQLILQRKGGHVLCKRNSY
jgi:hypothetical protein